MIKNNLENYYSFIKKERLIYIIGGGDGVSMTSNDLLDTLRQKLLEEMRRRRLKQQSSDENIQDNNIPVNPS